MEFLGLDFTEALLHGFYVTLDKFSKRPHA